MENYRVIIDGDVYQVPKANVGSQQEAEAAVRSYISRNSGVQQTSQRKKSGTARDILAGLTQGVTLGASDEILGRAEAFIRNQPAADTIARRRDDIRQAVDRNPAGFIGAEIAGAAIPATAISLLTKGKPPTGAVASRAGQLGQRIMSNRFGRGAAIGGAEGAIAGFNTGEGDAMQRAPGAAVGGALGAGLGSFAEFAQPKITQGAKDLAERYGIPLSPASLGDSGKALEMGARQVPFVGGAFRARRDDTLDAFNTAVVNEVLKGTGRRVNKIVAGRDAYAEAADQISEAYDEILNAVDEIPLGGGIGERASEILADLPKKSAKTLAETSQCNRHKNQHWRASKRQKQFKQADSLLRQLIATYQKGFSSTDPVVQLESEDLVSALTALRQDMLDNAGAAIGGQFATRLRGADFAYKKLQVLRKLVEGRGTAERFTPKQLQAAISNKFRKDGDQVARGTAPIQDLADAAAKELGDLEYSTARDQAVVQLLAGGGVGGGLLGADYLTDQDLETQTVLGLGGAAAGLGLLAGLSRPGAYRRIPQYANRWNWAAHRAAV